VKTPDAPGLLLKSLAAMRRTVATMADLVQQEDQAPEPKLEDSREWMELRDLILAALRPYPEALEAVARAMRKTEGAGQATTDSPILRDTVPP